MNLHTGADLKKLREDDLVQHFGENRPVLLQDRARKTTGRCSRTAKRSLWGAEDTFPHDLTTLEEMYPELDKIALTVANRLQKYQLKGRTVTLKIKYSDFRQITRNQSPRRASTTLKPLLPPPGSCW